MVLGMKVGSRVMTMPACREGDNGNGTGDKGGTQGDDSRMQGDDSRTQGDDGAGTW